MEWKSARIPFVFAPLGQCSMHSIPLHWTWPPGDLASGQVPSGPSRTWTPPGVRPGPLDASGRESISRRAGDPYGNLATVNRRYWAMTRGSEPVSITWRKSRPFWGWLGQAGWHYQGATSGYYVIPITAILHNNLQQKLTIS